MSDNNLASKILDEIPEDSDTNNIKIPNKFKRDIGISTKLSDEEMKKILDSEVRGVVMRIHPKPYPNYSYKPNPRKNQYYSKVSFEIVNDDDPYAKVDENLRQLKLYTENDVRPYYNRDGTKNKEKMPTNRYNQYVQKSMLFFPNTKNVSSGGKRKKINKRKTLKKKLKKRKQGKTKKRSGEKQKKK